MIIDRACADLSAAIYDPGSVWDYQTRGTVWAGIKYLDGVDAIAFRGSYTLDDWIRAFAAIPEITDHPTLGPLHSGMFDGVEEAAVALRMRLRPGMLLVLTGHSQGAAHAWYTAGVWLGVVPVARIVVFGSPRPGFAPLAGALSEISAISYRNKTPTGHDRVTDLAPAIPPELEWCQPRALTDVCAPPPAGDNGPFRWHYMTRYQQGLVDG